MLMLNKIRREDLVRRAFNFKFEACCSKDEECGKIIEDVWKNEQIHFVENLQLALSHCSIELSKWSKTRSTGGEKDIKQKPEV